ncbi:MAG: VWA domain-containing protein [Clostridia bacterium]|nr:VWA domain-containing protein [Clostridia bacterium]
MKSVGFYITVCLIMCLVLAIPAGALTLEQVQASPPQFDVYIYGDGADLSGVTADGVAATLGGATLDCTQVSRSEQGIFYIFMLDISGSIPENYFEAAKSAVLATSDKLREQDRLAVITFGNEVNVILTGDETSSDVQSALSGLSANDSKTMFYTAMDVLIETATKTSDMRRVAVVMSDGIDDSDAGMTQAELEDELINSGISVYALCIDTSSQTDKFGDFIRLSGGELYTFNPDSAQSVLDELMTRLGDSLCIRLMTYDAVSPGELTLTVDLGELGSVSTELSPDKWVADTTQPYISSVLFSIENNSLDVSFSEPVAGADDPGNYTLVSSDGAAVSIASASFSGSGKDSVSLCFSELPPAGNYRLSVTGITDMSANANPLHEYSDAVFLATGVQPGEAAAGWLSKDIIIYVVVGVGVVALVVFLGFLITRFNKLASKDKSADRLSDEDKKKIKKAEKVVRKEEIFVFTNAQKKTKPTDNSKTDDK